MDRHNSSGPPRMPVSPFHRFARSTYSSLHKHVLVYMPREFEASQRRVTLVMPLAAKDLSHAAGTIAAWRRFLLHPIDGVTILGQSSREISVLASRTQATYIDEETVLPPAVRAFVYRVSNRNRNGWIRQQILKLMADTVVPSGDLLIVDSDTRPVRPISFDYNGKPLCFLSDEYNSSYHACIHRLLGPLDLHPRSFIAHCMLFERDVLPELRAAMTTHTGLSWTDAILSAIDTRLEESFSEYETYGTFVKNRYPNRFQTAYWYNRKVRGTSLRDDFEAGPEHARFNFVSRHVHLSATGDG